MERRTFIHDDFVFLNANCSQTRTNDIVVGRFIVIRYDAIDVIQKAMMAL